MADGSFGKIHGDNPKLARLYNSRALDGTLAPDDEMALDAGLYADELASQTWNLAERTGRPFALVAFAYYDLQLLDRPKTGRNIVHQIDGMTEQEKRAVLKFDLEVRGRNSKRTPTSP